MAKQATPLEVVFYFFKASFGISHRALGELILSNKPLPNGQTPVQLANDTSWLSRSVVHAEPDSLQDRLFDDFTASSRHIYAELSLRGYTDGKIITEISRETEKIEHSLVVYGQNGGLYRNALARFITAKKADPVQAIAALLLMITSACACSPTAAIAHVERYLSKASKTDKSFTPPLNVFSCWQPHWT